MSQYGYQHHRPLNSTLSSPPMPPPLPHCLLFGPAGHSPAAASSTSASLASPASKTPSTGKKFENLADGDRRPSALVAKYAELYSQTRVDAYEALSEVTELAEARELKEKLLFSVVVVNLKLMKNLSFGNFVVMPPIAVSLFHHIALVFISSEQIIDHE